MKELVDPSTTFDFDSVWLSIKTNRKLIAAITISGTILGFLSFVLIASQNYTAVTEFIIRNPSYGERNNIFNREPANMNYFSSEDEYERFISFSKSYVVQKKVSDAFRLDTLYEIDTTKKAGIVKLLKKINNKLRVARTDNSILFLTYTDKDAQRAADIANKFIAVLDSQFTGYYMEMRNADYLAVKDKLAVEDSMINVFTDSLVKIRERYNIYDLISPARHGLISGNTNYTKRPGMALGLETLQNLEANKDEMVSDRALTLTLVNQFESSLKRNRFNVIKVITPAYAPRMLGLLSHFGATIACMFTSFFFSIIFCLYADFRRFKKVNKL